MAEIHATDVRIVAGADTAVVPQKKLWQRLEPTVLGTGTILLLLLVWQIWPEVFPLKAGTKLFFAVPSQVAGTLWNMIATGAIWTPLRVSATAFTIGLALAIIVGLPLGVLIGRSSTLAAMLD